MIGFFLVPTYLFSLDKKNKNNIRIYFGEISIRKMSTNLVIMSWHYKYSEYTGFLTMLFPENIFFVLLLYSIKYEGIFLFLSINIKIINHVIIFWSANTVSGVWSICLFLTWYVWSTVTLRLLDNAVYYDLQEKK